MKVIILLVILMLPLMLGATLQAHITQMCTATFDFEYGRYQMDTDSTLAVYKLINGVSSPRQLVMRRLHPNGYLEDEQAIYTFGGDLATGYLEQEDFFPEEFGRTLRILAGRPQELVYLIVNGSSVQAYTINLAQAGLLNTRINPVFLENKLVFTSSTAPNQESLMCWDYLAGELMLVHSLLPGYNGNISRLGTEGILLCQMSQQVPGPNRLNAFDNQLNLILEGFTDFRMVQALYMFDPNTFYATWSANYSNNMGTLSIADSSFTFDLLDSNGINDDWTFSYDFLFPLGGDLHACMYSYGDMWGQSYERFEKYQNLGDGTIDQYFGFPDLGNYPSDPSYVSWYQGRLMSIHSNGYSDHFFKLADLQTMQWAVVYNNPWIAAPEVYYSKYLSSNEYIYLHSGYYGFPVVAACLRLDVSTSEDDPQAPQPGLRAYPNPFRSTVRLEIESPKPGAILQIFNLRGQRVRTLQSEAGACVWDGKDERGNSLGAGIYFARPASGGKALKFIKTADSAM